MMNFYVGQKVVCVDASNNRGRMWIGNAPTVGQVYTITGFKPDVVRRGGVAVQLKELRNEGIEGDDWGYGAWRFRPLVERKTSIELLTSIRPDTPIVGPEIERERFKELERA